MYSISNTARRELLHILPALGQADSKDTRSRELRRRALRMTKYITNARPTPKPAPVKLPDCVVDEIKEEVQKLAQEFASQRPDNHFGYKSDEVELEVECGKFMYYVLARYKFSYFKEHNNVSGPYAEANIDYLTTVVEVLNNDTGVLYPPFGETIIG